MHALPLILSPMPDLQELEARAVDRAKATSDANFVPSLSILNATSAEPLLQQVDGSNLLDYDAKESVYVGRSVPIAAGATLTVPISVSVPGSVVEYAVELSAYDIGVGIEAERADETTTVKAPSRLSAEESPLTQKFLVGTVPCLIQFTFDNSYSWLREKSIDYKVTVTPPSKESLREGRRRRAKACLKAVDEDLAAASQRLSAAEQQQATLQQDVAGLEQQLAEKKKALQIAQKEAAWLVERRALREEQRRLLKERLDKGWKDETA